MITIRDELDAEDAEARLRFLRTFYAGDFDGFGLEIAQLEEALKQWAHQPAE